MTEPRRVIARVLSTATDHPDAEELHRRANAQDASISLATVYRTVKLFEDAGIIQAHDFRDGRARYEEVPDEHHDHLINVRTGEVVEFHSEEIERLHNTERERSTTVTRTLSCVSHCHWSAHFSHHSSSRRLKSERDSACG